MSRWALDGSDGSGGGASALAVTLNPTGRTNQRLGNACALSVTENETGRTFGWSNDGSRFDAFAAALQPATRAHRGFRWSSDADAAVVAEYPAAGADFGTSDGLGRLLAHRDAAAVICAPTGPVSAHWRTFRYTGYADTQTTLSLEAGRAGDWELKRQAARLTLVEFEAGNADGSAWANS
jgi:hypothetical protein